MWVTVKVRIEGDASKGISPLLRHSRCRFRGPELAQAWGLVNQFVYLQVNNRDIRIARVYNEHNGQLIGNVSPDNRWQFKKTSWRNFVMIQKFGKIERDAGYSSDPTAEFLAIKTNQLADNPNKNKKGDNRKAATDIKRIQRVINSPTPLGEEPINYQEPKKPHKQLKNDNKSLADMFGAPPEISSFSRGG